MSAPHFDDSDFYPSGEEAADPSVAAKPVRVFLNARFLATSPSPTLLSIGFASDTGRELYVVIADVDTRECTDPVVRLALDVLHHGNPEVLGRREAAERISDWLDELRAGEPADILEVLLTAKAGWDLSIHLIADCGTTLDLFHGLFGVENRLSNVDGLLADQVFSGAWLSKFLHLREKYHESGGNPHHSLNAAMGIRHAWDLVFDNWD